MQEQSHERPNQPPIVTARRSRARELWSLHGATDDLRGLAIETSFGHALALELDREIILLHLQPSIETLCDLAARIETALLAQGWQRTPATSPTSKEHP